MVRSLRFENPRGIEAPGRVSLFKPAPGDQVEILAPNTPRSDSRRVFKGDSHREVVGFLSAVMECVQQQGPPLGHRNQGKIGRRDN